VTCAAADPGPARQIPSHNGHSHRVNPRIFMWSA
jgi:hypothetical protein